MGRIESWDFLAPSTLDLYLSGYPGRPGLRLLLKNMNSGEERELTPPSQPGDEWQYDSLVIPSEWIGRRVRFIAEDQATGPYGWMAFSLPILPAWSFSLPVIDETGPPGGFCSDGVYRTTKWPGAGPPQGIHTWGSYCKSGDKDVGWGTSPPINAASELVIYIAGYPDTPGLDLAVENMQTGRQVQLHVPKPPGEMWQLQRFALPSEWNGQLIRVIARDQATEMRGWLGFSEPLLPPPGEKAINMAETLGLGFLLGVVLLLPAVAVGIWLKRRGSEKVFPVVVAALIALGSNAVIYFIWFRTPANGITVGFAGLLVGCVVIAYCILRSGWLGLSELSGMPEVETLERSELFSQHPGRERVVLILAWILAAIAILPAIFHWPALPPFTGFARYIPTGLGYLAALAICYGIACQEMRRLSRRQTVILVFGIFLLTCIVNNLHSINVDYVTKGFAYPNRVWQADLQDSVVQLVAFPPHSYRFLPNAIVRWMQLGHMDYDAARNLYRLLAGLLLFYAIYKFARLYCSYIGSIIAMLLTAVIYPISFEYYAGQLSDPLSHLSFVLAFIFLETEEFALLLTTLVIGSLAKETVLAMAGYYVLFCRKETNYPLKAAALCLVGAAAYFGVRLFVLHGTMQYQQVSGVTLDQVWENLQNGEWQVPFLLTACALVPFLLLGWNETPLSLKRLTIFLFPVLFVSSLFFSWLRESRNFMPLVFVLAVAAGGYLSRQSVANLKREPAPDLQRKEAIISGD